jgi:hypothetical protein
VFTAHTEQMHVHPSKKIIAAVKKATHQIL